MRCSNPHDGHRNNSQPWICFDELRAEGIGGSLVVFDKIKAIKKRCMDCIRKFRAERNPLPSHLLQPSLAEGIVEA